MSYYHIMHITYAIPIYAYRLLIWKPIYEPAYSAPTYYPHRAYRIVLLRGYITHPSIYATRYTAIWPLRGVYIRF